MKAKILLATDFDGTIAPIQRDPQAVVADPELSNFLCEAAEVDGVCVAIISGRDIEDLSRRVGAIPAYLAGSHGLEIRAPGGQMLRQVAPLRIPVDPDIERAVLAAGGHIERKKHGIALHWRGVDGFDESNPLALRFRAWALGNSLDVIEGRRVIEARQPGGGKEVALEFIARILQPERIVYAGDDLTDLAALAYAAERGRAFFIRSDERENAPGAESLASRRELLRELEAELRDVIQMA